MIFLFKFFKTFLKAFWREKFYPAFCSEKAEGNIGPIIGIFILVVIYLASPDLIHNFIQTLIDMVFDALHSAFGTGDDSPFGTKEGGDGSVGKNGKINVPDPQNPPPAK